MTTRNIPGNVPQPEELYGRDQLIEHLWRQIQGNNILLLAPRRFGKTGVMTHVHKSPREGYLPIYLDLEDVNSPAEFVWRLTASLLAEDTLRRVLASAKRLPAAMQDWVKDTFDEAEFEGAKVKFKDAVGATWTEQAARLLLEMEKAGPTVIFILDELPGMLQKIRAAQGDDVAKDFVGWFRRVRLEQKDQLRRHRFIVAGSTGIDVLLRHLGAADKFNDFERIYVEPLRLEDAGRLVSDLAASQNIELPEQLIPNLLELIGPPVPYFIHLLFSQLGQLPPDERRPLGIETLRAVYQRRLLGPTCKHYFDHYRGRLGQYERAIEHAAVAILRAVAEAPTGRVSASALYGVYNKARRKGTEHEFEELMADLECDWYLVLDVTTNEYSFLISVMRDWWRRWYGSLRPDRRTRNISGH